MTEKRERETEAGGNKRDCKLAGPTQSVFSDLSRLNGGQQGVGPDMSESPWQPILQPPTHAHAHTHTLHTHHPVEAGLGCLHPCPD